MQSNHSRPNAPSVVDLDPEDPTQLLDEAGQFSVVDVDLEVEAQPHAEADAELDAAVATTADDYTDITDDTEMPDTGDLYGIHMPKAADRDLDVNPDGESFRDADLGEHAFETLEKKMAENGAAPEEELDVTDDSDPDGGHHKTDTRDRPIADRGSGGPGGL